MHVACTLMFDTIPYLLSQTPTQAPPPNMYTVQIPETYFSGRLIIADIVNRNQALYHYEPLANYHQHLQ